VAVLKQEGDDYAARIAAPDNAISGKAALTKQVSPAFNAFEDKLQEIDDLILPLRRTVAGATFVAKYQEARSINDRGHGPVQAVPKEVPRLLPPPQHPNKPFQPPN